MREKEARFARSRIVITTTPADAKISVMLS